MIPSPVSKSSDCAKYSENPTTARTKNDAEAHAKSDQLIVPDRMNDDATSLADTCVAGVQ